jgi:hypothetical protein
MALSKISTDVGSTLIKPFEYRSTSLTHASESGAKLPEVPGSAKESKVFWNSRMFRLCLQDILATTCLSKSVKALEAFSVAVLKPRECRVSTT